jgi:hypothetical protein
VEPLEAAAVQGAAAARLEAAAVQGAAAAQLEAGAVLRPEVARAGVGAARRREAERRVAVGPRRAALLPLAAASAGRRDRLRRAPAPRPAVLFARVKAALRIASR